MSQKKDDKTDKKGSPASSPSRSEEGATTPASEFGSGSFGSESDDNTPRGRSDSGVTTRGLASSLSSFSGDFTGDLSSVGVFKFEPDTRPLSAHLHIDLTAYVQAHEQYKAAKAVAMNSPWLEDRKWYLDELRTNYATENTPAIKAKIERLEKELQKDADGLCVDEKREYNKIRVQIQDDLSAFTGGSLWQNLFAKATEQLTPEDILALQQYPAIQFLERHFIEILKNTMDEALLAYYDPMGAGRPASIDLSLNIEIKPESVVVELADTGRGFPPPFLAKMATRETRKDYCEEVKDVAGKQGRSTENAKKKGEEDRVKLFGGQGIGTRALIADVEWGASLDRSGMRAPRYDIDPEKFHLSFSNAPGAVLVIKTPIQPLVPISMINQTAAAYPSSVFSLEDSEKSILKPMDLGTARFRKRPLPVSAPDSAATSSGTAGFRDTVRGLAGRRDGPVKDNTDDDSVKGNQPGKPS